MSNRKTSLREIDLRPYQAHLLFQSSANFTLTSVASLLDELPLIIDDGIRQEEDFCNVLEKCFPRNLHEEILGWLVYRRTTPVSWIKGVDVPRNSECHLVVLLARRAFLTIVSTDKALGPKISRTSVRASRWSKLARIPSRKIEDALVHGATRALWLTGIHRSVATKPDSKVLIGSDLEAALDALGDQDYHYTSTRCEGPTGKLPASLVGVTPRLAKVWLGPSPSWEVFLVNSRRLLQLFDSVKQSASAPYPVLARANSSLGDVREAFDISLTPPEFLYDEHPDLVQQLESVLQGSTRSVKGETGPNCVVNFQGGLAVGQLRITLSAQGQDVVHEVTPLGNDLPEELEKLSALVRRPELLKIFYESAHTYSNGQIFEVKTRSIPFEVTERDFAGCDITLEKPEGSAGRRSVDLGQIGAKSDRSLFTWVWKTYKKGWLWCDDGSGEIADFIHLDQTKSILSLIHVKAANSSSERREISVSAYEVVCSQALKNLRYTERAELEKPLKKKMLAEAHLVRGWKNGEELRPGSTDFLSAVATVRYSELQRRVVVIQPHVRKSLLPKDIRKEGKSARQARLLFTLLHAVKADVNRYGVDFEVLVDK